MVDGSPVVGAEGSEEGAEEVVEEAAEAHPDLVEVPADDPSGGEKTRGLYKYKICNRDIP